MRRLCISLALQGILVAAPSFALQGPVTERGTYRIGAGDVLDIVVWTNAELSMQVVVRPDGMISLPLLNDVRAEGITPMDLREVLTERLSEFVTSPQIYVLVTEIRSFQVSILGKVERPGRYPLEGSATVLDVLALAGGFQDFSSPDDMYVVRASDETYERIPVKYSVAISPGGKSVNIAVRSGDLIIVP